MAGKDEGERPIIIVKKKGHGGHGHHGGAWKVAYADFVTAMMALFMVLWLVAQSPKTKSAVGAYFRDPLGLAGGGNTELNTGPSSGGAGFFAGGNTAVAVDVDFSSGQNSDTASAKRVEMPELSNARNRLAQALMALRMDSWSRHVELTAVEQGLRVEIQDSKDQHLFAPGSAKVSDTARPVLEIIAQELGHLPNRIAIEGHTDATPIRGRADNWELSTARANAARKYLAAHGLRRNQVVEVRGYADRRPRYWHNPADPRNRRISILVLLERARAPEKPAQEAPPPSHLLLQRLKQIDMAAQGPAKELELAPDGSQHLPQ